MLRKSSLLLLALTCSCAQDLRRFEDTEPHMGTLVRITLHAPDALTASKAFRAAFARIRELDGILSDYRPDSELMRLCSRAGGTPVPVSEDLYRVLEYSQKLAAESNGAFDVTVGPLTRLWRAAREQRQLPDVTPLAAALAKCGYRNLQLDAAARTALLLQKGMVLDVGGIAKGYAAEEALAVLRKLGLPRALVAVSGDLAAGDAPPGKPGWSVGITTLDGSSRTLVLSNQCVSTAGDDEQHLEIGGVRYSHIVDPRIGLGLTEPIRVSVIAPSGLEADGLDTAISVLGVDAGTALAERHPQATAVISVPGRTVTTGPPRKTSQ